MGPHKDRENSDQGGSFSLSLSVYMLWKAPKGRIQFNSLLIILFKQLNSHELKFLIINTDVHVPKDYIYFVKNFLSKVDLTSLLLTLISVMTYDIVLFIIIFAECMA